MAHLRPRTVLRPQLTAKPAILQRRVVRPLRTSAENLAAPTGIAAPIETIELGRTGLQVPAVSVGAWSWGDNVYWGYGGDYGRDEVKKAYDAITEAGVGFIDTAEVYGAGTSEEFIGEFMQQTNTRPLIATKFAPLPWRFTSNTVTEACEASLKRLRLKSVDLYMIHWPGFLTTAFSNDAFLEGLAACHTRGMAKTLGVSNFSGKRVRRAAQLLGERGTSLASNQVQYNLLYRSPERNGMMEACREVGATLVAFSPLCQGMLTGKYRAGGKKPSGPRGFIYNESVLSGIEPLLSVMEAVAQERGKSVAQVAINWVICKGALPLVGAKTDAQVMQIAGAAGWRLTEGEVAELDAVSARMKPATGPPYENW